MNFSPEGPELMVGGIRLVELVGRGASGRVYRGVTPQNDIVAVKLLREELAEDPLITGRLVQEFQVLNALPGPNVVRAHRIVAEAGHVGLVMDFVGGGDVRRLLVREGNLGPAEAVDILTGVLTGLASAHSGGVVHRDIKPENVMLDVDGTVRITDFGIARVLQGPTTTRGTGLIGSPHYMAPELTKRVPVTPAADVYAAGCMLYELLTGVTPFEGGPEAAVLLRHLQELPGRPPGMPDELWRVLVRMLEKDPDRRPDAEGTVRQLHVIRPALEGEAALPLLSSPPESTDDTLEEGTPEGATVLRRIDRPADPHPSKAAGGRARKRGLMASGAAILVLVLLGVGTAIARDALTTAEAMTTEPQASGPGASPQATPQPTTEGDVPEAGANGSTSPDPDTGVPAGSDGGDAEADGYSGDGSPAPAQPPGSPQQQPPTTPAQEGRPGDTHTSNLPAPERPAPVKEPTPPVKEPTKTSNSPPTPPLAITSSALPSGTVGEAYTTTVSATGGQTPYSWSAEGLPGGLAISPMGALSGSPAQAGTSTVTLVVTDAAGQKTKKVHDLKIAAAPLIGDIDHDGKVDCSDYALLQAAWDWGGGTRAGDPADLNGDKSVDALDYSLMSSHWTGSPGSC